MPLACQVYIGFDGTTGKSLRAPNHPCSWNLQVCLPFCEQRLTPKDKFLVYIPIHTLHHFVLLSRPTNNKKISASRLYVREYWHNACKIFTTHTYLNDSVGRTSGAVPSGHQQQKRKQQRHSQSHRAQEEKFYPRGASRASHTLRFCNHWRKLRTTGFIFQLSWDSNNGTSQNEFINYASWWRGCYWYAWVGHTHAYKHPPDPAIR